MPCDVNNLSQRISGCLVLYSLTAQNPCFIHAEVSNAPNFTSRRLTQGDSDIKKCHLTDLTPS